VTARREAERICDDGDGGQRERDGRRCYWRGGLSGPLELACYMTLVRLPPLDPQRTVIRLRLYSAVAEAEVRGSRSVVFCPQMTPVVVFGNAEAK